MIVHALLEDLADQSSTAATCLKKHHDPWGGVLSQIQCAHLCVCQRWGLYGVCAHFFCYIRLACNEVLDFGCGRLKIWFEACIV